MTCICLMLYLLGLSLLGLSKGITDKVNQFKKKS